MKTIYQLISSLVIALALTAAAETNAPPGFRLKGTVIDTGGNLVQGATVERYSSSRMTVFSGEGMKLEQRVVATNGVFELELPSQGALILVRKPGLAVAWRQVLNPVSDVEERLRLSQPSTLGGLVVDEAGKPVANAEVSVPLALMEAETEGGGRSISYLSGLAARECFSARTSTDGRFRIEGFPTNAAADLVVQSPGKALRPPSEQRQSLDFGSLQGHAGQDDIRLVVEPAGTFEGKIVTDAESEPVPVARLSVQADGPVFFAGGGRLPTESRADGTFRISDLAPGGYRLRAVFGTNPVPDWVADSVPVSVEAGQITPGVQVTATHGGLLEVTVIGQKDRKPLARVDLNAFKNGFQTSATSDSNGKALLRLLEGDYQISAFMARAQSVSATVETGKTNTIEIEVPAPTKISGVVRTQDGQPAAGAGVQIVGGYSANRNNPLRTDANGKFELQFDPNRSGRPDMKFCLLVRDPEHNLAVAQEIDEETGPLDLRLAPAMTIAALVECQGKPVTNATAALVFWTGTTGMHLPGLATGTNAPCRLEIRALPLGRKYGLSVSALGYGTKFVNVTESETEPKRFELDPIELKPANLKLAGQVVDDNDKPVAGATVNLIGDGQPNGYARTDRDGRFRFEAACEGTVRLFANVNASQGNVSAEGGDTNVVIKLGQRTGFASSATARKLKGIVTDPDGKPVSGAQVAVFPFPSGRVQTGPNGAFILNWTVQPYQLQSNRKATLVLRHVTRNLAAAEDLSEDTTNLDVQLTPGFSVIGKVESADGTLLTNAQVGAMLELSSSYSAMDEQLSRTDAQGNFEIKALPPGPKYVVYATAKDYGRHQQKVDPFGFLTNRVELAPFILELANEMIAGDVLDAQDKPASGVRVSVSGENQPTGSATTDRKGHFSFKVCRGSVRLFASGPNGSASQSVFAGDTNVILQLSARNTVTSRTTTSPRSLRNLTPFGLDADASPGKPLLLCLFDAEQPPSRRSARQLAARYEALQQRKIDAVGIQAAIIPNKTWQAWTNSNSLPFPVGRAAKKSAGASWATGVASLPWLILRNASGTLVAEGFTMDELDAQLTKLKR